MRVVDNSLKPDSGISSVSKFTFTKTLKLGITAHEAKELQKFLNINGFSVALSGLGSNGNETSYFGKLTSAALAKFQEVNKDNLAGLVKEKGFFGPITQQFVNSFVDTEKSVSQKVQNLPPIVFTKPLYKGLQSEDVRKLQVLLARKPEIYSEGLTTGYFGSLTEKAVQTFQLKYGVVVVESDPGFGYVGPKTRMKLSEVFDN